MQFEQQDFCTDVGDLEINLYLIILSVQLEYLSTNYLNLAFLLQAFKFQVWLEKEILLFLTTNLLEFYIS